MPNLEYDEDNVDSLKEAIRILSERLLIIDDEEGIQELKYDENNIASVKKAMHILSKRLLTIAGEETIIYAPSSESFQNMIKFGTDELSKLVKKLPKTKVDHVANYNDFLLYSQTNIILTGTKYKPIAFQRLKLDFSAKMRNPGDEISDRAFHTVIEKFEKYTQGRCYAKRDSSHNWIYGIIFNNIEEEEEKESGILYLDPNKEEIDPSKPIRNKDFRPNGSKRMLKPLVKIPNIKSNTNMASIPIPNITLNLISNNILNPNQNMQLNIVPNVPLNTVPNVPSISIPNMTSNPVLNVLSIPNMTSNPVLNVSSIPNMTSDPVPNAPSIPNVMSIYHI